MRQDSPPVDSASLKEDAVDPEEREDAVTYRVVVNDEEQYSIWPADRDLPDGWSDAGRTGTRAECLAHVGEVWTDMRPLSLRRRMAMRDGGSR